MEASIGLNGDEAIYTHGGESWIDDYYHADYGITIGDATIHGLKPAQMVELAKAVVNHLMICGHRFEIRPTKEHGHAPTLVHTKAPFSHEN
jgi:hypothetical protein